MKNKADNKKRNFLTHSEIESLLKAANTGPHAARNDTSVATKAAVAFLGTAIDSAHPKVLALQSSAAGSATNVGVQILDRTGNELTLDGATFSAQTTLNNGTNTIPFQARYYAIGEATPGAANADATFKVQYQ